MLTDGHNETGRMRNMEVHRDEKVLTLFEVVPCHTRSWPPCVRNFRGLFLQLSWVLPSLSCDSKLSPRVTDVWTAEWNSLLTI